MSLRPITDPQRWDETVDSLGGHPLQQWAWGELKAAHGWRAHRVVVESGDTVIGAAAVLVRPLPWPLRGLAYVPRGPVVADPAHAPDVAAAVAEWCRSLGVVAVTIEPDWDRADGPNPATWPGWRPADSTILYPRTLILDLTRSEEDLLKGAHKNTRYDIRKAARSGVELAVVKSDAELAEVLDVYQDTGERAGFGLHSDEYYRDLYRLGGASNIISYARVDGAVVAFSWALCSAKTAFYLYGGSNAAGQKSRANRPVLWDCIQRAQAAGVTRFDLNGLLNDGISDFKQSFDPHREDMLAGSFDRPLSPLYPAFQRALPWGKKAVQLLGRLRGRRRAETGEAETAS